MKIIFERLLVTYRQTGHIQKISKMQNGVHWLIKNIDWFRVVLRKSSSPKTRGNKIFASGMICQLLRFTENEFFQFRNGTRTRRISVKYNISSVG